MEWWKLFRTVWARSISTTGSDSEAEVQIPSQDRARELFGQRKQQMQRSRGRNVCKGPEENHCDRSIMGVTGRRMWEGQVVLGLAGWVQFSSVAHSCPTLCDPMDCSTPSFSVHHQLPEFSQTNVHRVSDAIQPSHPLSSPSPPAFNLSHHQDLFQWVSSSHQVTKVLELQLQHQSSQWIFRTDFL